MGFITRFGIVLLLFLNLPYFVSAQKGVGFVSGSVVINPKDKLSGPFRTLEPINDATVKVIAGRDTLYTSTQNNGQFYLKKVPVGPVEIIVTHIGYKRESFKAELRKGENLFHWFRLEEALEELAPVEVKGEVPLYTQRGDTLIYNAAAVKTLEGDETIEILKQLPGILVDEHGGVSVLGKEISRTYLNGRLIFGDDPRAALYNLLAKEVVQIKVYDEVSVMDRIRGKKKSQDMDRVLDIVTRTPIISAASGHFLASGGSDFAKDDKGELKKRYGLGATANFFSERLLLSANGFSNNINRSSNRLSDILNIPSVAGTYNRNHFLEADAETFWGERWKGTGLKAKYIYDDSYTRSGSIWHRDYFPTADYTTKQSADTLRNTSEQETHRVDLSTSFFTKATGSVSLATVLTLDRTHRNSFQAADDRIDDFFDRRRVTDRSRDKHYSWRQNLQWIPSNGKGGDLPLRPVFTFSSDIGNNDGSGLRVDTLSAQTGKKILTSSPFGQNRKYTGGVDFTIELNPKKIGGANLQVNYRVDYTRNKTRKYTLNEYDPAENPTPLDTANSWNYTYNYLTHHAGLSYRGHLRKLNIGLGLAGSISRLNKDESFPEPYGYGKTYRALLPSLSLSYIKGMQTVVGISYMATTALPSIEQLRPQINDRNPLALTAGNPSLKSPYGQIFMFSFSPLPSKKGATFSGRVDFRTTGNDITTRSRFFKTATLLPEHDNYLAPANSTLYTYENIGGTMRLDAIAEYNRRLKAIRSTLRLTGQYSFDRQPSYVGEETNTMRSNRGSLAASLNGTLSKSVKLTLGASAAYTYSRNTERRDNKFITGGAKMGLDVRFLKQGFFKANYQYSGYHFVTETGTDISNHILNALAGFYFYKKNGAVSLSVFDLLNRTRSFKSAMTPYYIENRWTPTFGRYWTINMSFRFNSTKAGKTNAPGNLHDGSKEKPDSIFQSW